MIIDHSHDDKNTGRTAQYIRHLFIDGMDQPQSDLPYFGVGELLQLLVLTTSLRSIRIRHVSIHFRYDGDTNMLPLPLPALQELTLEELFQGKAGETRFPIDNVLSLLSYFPSLSAFTVRHTGLCLKYLPTTGQATSLPPPQANQPQTL